MSSFSNFSEAGISFTEIFGEEEGSISLRKVEEFLNRVVQVASEKAEVSPNQLVRVVHGNQITWMTQKQAAEFLQEENSPAIQRDVERAIKGELKYVRQELEILLALAVYTFHQFKENDAIGPAELERIAPSLKRRRQEINEGIQQTAEAEILMMEKRRRSPLLGEYEHVMGDFLNAKAEGDHTRALQLAQELSQKKRQYLLLARAIEPDLRTIYYQRLNLQKTKKRILNTQNELCASRKDALMIEIEDLRQSLEQVRMDLAAPGAGLPPTSAADPHSPEILHKAEELTHKTQELTTLDTESAILEKQQKEVDTVIQHISENVLQETEIKVNVKETYRNAAKPAPAKKEPESEKGGVTVVRGSGMHVGNLRKNN